MRVPPYEVEFRTAAALQTRPLHKNEYVSLIEALQAAARDPFDHAHSEPTPDVHVRRIDFGVDVVGRASVVVDPVARRLRVFDVRWTS